MRRRELLLIVGVVAGQFWTRAEDECASSSLSVMDSGVVAVEYGYVFTISKCDGCGCRGSAGFAVEIEKGQELKEEDDGAWPGGGLYHG